MADQSTSYQGDSVTNPISPHIFAFDDHMVRTVDQDGEAWFVAHDVCKALDIANPRDAVSRLDDDERMTVGTTDSHSGQRGGAQSWNIINESGLYSLIFTSRKEEAKRFKKWITSEVLPTIRKTGQYAMADRPASQPSQISWQQQSLKLVNALKNETNKELRRYLYAQLQNASEKMGLEAPALEHIGCDEPAVPPVVERFWQVYEALIKLGHNLNHHTQSHLIAINLKEFLKAAEDNGMAVPSRIELSRALKSSRDPMFISSNTSVRSKQRRQSVKSWVFEIKSDSAEV